MSVTTALAIASTALLPLALLVAHLAFRWRYLRAIRHTMYTGSMPAPDAVAAGAATSARPALEVVSTSAGAGSSTAGPREVQAAAQARAFRRALSISGTVFVVATAFVVWQAQSANVGARAAVAIAYFSTFSGIVLTHTFARRGWRLGVAVIAGWTAGALALLVGALSLPWAVLPSLLPDLLFFAVLPLPAVWALSLRRLRPLLVAFVPMVGLWLVATAAVVGLIGAPRVHVSTLPQAAIGVAVLNLVAGVVVAAYLFRRGLRWWHMGVLAGAAATTPVVAAVDGSPAWLIPAGIGTNAITTLAVGWVFRGFVRLKAGGWLPDEILHAGLCWLVLTAFLAIQVQSPPWLLLPLAAYAVTLSWLVARRTDRTGAVQPERLLLLRVFDQGPARRRLLALLDETWRRIGTVDLVVGVDVAESTLSAAALENFMFGRVHRQFVRNEGEATDRIAALARHREADGRFPINELHCLPDAWRDVVAHLARTCDVALMDLRGLQPANTGALFELALVIDRVALDRVVVLVDDLTDDAALRRVAYDAWARLADDSPNAAGPVPRLTLLRCDEPGAEEGIARVLVAAVARARSTLQPA